MSKQPPIPQTVGDITCLKDLARYYRRPYNAIRGELKRFLSNAENAAKYGQHVRGYLFPFQVILLTSHWGPPEKKLFDDQD